MAHYRLTDNVATQVLDLLIFLASNDKNLVDPIDPNDKSLIKKKLNGEEEINKENFNYEGLQCWLLKQPIIRRQQHNFSSEFLRQQLNPERRQDNKGPKGKDGIEYLEDLIDAVNSLRYDSSQKYNGEIERKLNEKGFDPIEFNEESYEIAKFSMSKSRRLSQAADNQEQDSLPTQDADEAEVIEATPLPYEGDLQISQRALAVRDHLPIQQAPLRLNGLQIEELQQVLQKVFYQRKMFAIMMRVQLDANIELLASDGTHSERIFEVIEALNAEDRAEDLLKGALRARPNSPDLLELATKWLKS